MSVCINTSCFHFSSSGSSCSLAAGLESLGLTDIRTLVRLMCLAAAGRAGLSTSPSNTLTSSADRSRGLHTKTSKPISCLAYLSTAVGCLASSTPSAARLLVQLCTQVSYILIYLYLLSFVLTFYVFVQIKFETSDEQRNAEFKSQ